MTARTESFGAVRPRRGRQQVAVGERWPVSGELSRNPRFTCRRRDGLIEAAPSGVVPADALTNAPKVIVGFANDAHPLRGRQSRQRMEIVSIPCQNSPTVPWNNSPSSRRHSARVWLGTIQPAWTTPQHPWAQPGESDCAPAGSCLRLGEWQTAKDKAVKLTALKSNRWQIMVSHSFLRCVRFPFPRIPKVVNYAQSSSIRRPARQRETGILEEHAASPAAREEGPHPPVEAIGYPRCPVRSNVDCANLLAMHV